jgi:hypothetical protein
MHKATKNCLQFPCIFFGFLNNTKKEKCKIEVAFILAKTNLSFLNNPGRGEETVNGLLRITNFDTFSEFFRAHVNP